MHSVICVKWVPESTRIRVRPLTNISQRPSGDSHGSPRTALVRRGAGPARRARWRNHFPHSNTRRRTRFLSHGVVLACRALWRSRIRRRRLTADQLCVGGRDPQEFAADIVRPSLLSPASRSSIVSSNSQVPASARLAHWSSRNWSKMGGRDSPRERSSDRLMLDRRIGRPSSPFNLGRNIGQAYPARSTIGRASRELRRHRDPNRLKRADVPTSPVSASYADLICADPLAVRGCRGICATAW